MKCRYHPEEDAVAVCQKFGYGYCLQCCQETEEGKGCACSSPEDHCKFRQECLVHFTDKRRKKGLKGM